MAWFLNPALTAFRNEVNAAYPRRDKGSDGTIGDPAHAARTSDHNPDADGSVDAWDMDVELNGRGIPFLVDVELLKKLFQAHESSSYWIHNDQIASRSEGWVRKSYAYAGPDRNRHTQHVHWNTRSAFENSTKPWGVEEQDMTPLESKRLEAIDARVAAILSMKTQHQSSWSDVNPTGTEQVLIVQKVLELDGQLTALQARVEVLAGAEAARDAALKALLEQHHAGTLSAEAVVARMGALLSGQG